MHSKKQPTKRFALAASLLFMAFLILPTLVWGCLNLIGKYQPDLMKQLDYDLGENRTKASLPENFDPVQFPGQLEAYYNDRIPFRSYIVSANTAITSATEDFYKDALRPALIRLLYPNETNSPSGDSILNADLDSLLGHSSGSENPPENTPEILPVSSPEPSAPEAPKHHYVQTESLDPTCTEEGYLVFTCNKCEDSYREVLPATGHTYIVLQTVEADYDTYGYNLCRCAVCNMENRMNFTEKLIDTTYLPPTVMNETTIEGRRNWLFYTGNSSVAYYRGTNLLEQETLDDYATRVQTLQDICDSKGIQLQLMIIPNKEQVYEEYMPSYTIENTSKRVPLLTQHILDATGVDILYPLTELKAGKLYWQTYCKYDTHWTHTGAFIATQKLYGALGLPTTGITEMEFEVTTRLGGDLVSLGALDPAKYTDDMVYTPIYKPEVTVLEGKGDLLGAGTYTAKSDSTNDCNFVLIGDSFRLQMIPYLEKDFSRILVTHRDNLSSSKVTEAVLNADILVVTAVERYDNRLMNSISTLIEILSGDENEDQETQTQGDTPSTGVSP